MYYKTCFPFCPVISRIKFQADMIRNIYINKAENDIAFIYHKRNLVLYEKIVNLHLSSVLSYFLKLDLLGYLNYDVTPTFSDVTVIAISAFGHSGIISSLIASTFLSTTQ